MNNTAIDFLVHIRETVNTLILDPELMDQACENYEKIIEALGIQASEECDPDRFLQLHNDKIMFKILLDIVQEAKYRRDNFND